MNCHATARDAASSTASSGLAAKKANMRRNAATSQNRTAPHTAHPMLNTSTAPAAMSFTTPAVMYRSGAGRSTVRSRLELTSSSAKTPHTMSVMRMYSVLPKP